MGINLETTAKWRLGHQSPSSCEGFSRWAVTCIASEVTHGGQNSPENGHVYVFDYGVALDLR